LDDLERASSVARLVGEDAQSLPLESFITAATVALAEMAGTEVSVRDVYQATLDAPWGDVSAMVSIKSASDGLVVLSFPERTAAAIAERVLADVKAVINESLVQDCVCEIANVIAGQAKTLLAGTPHQFAYSLPRVVSGDLSQSRPETGRGCLVAAFRSDLGEFTLRLALES
jgi:chemotaxis protein CheX